MNSFGARVSSESVDSGVVSKMAGICLARATSPVFMPMVMPVSSRIGHRRSYKSRTSARVGQMYKITKPGCLSRCYNRSSSGAMTASVLPEAVAAMTRVSCPSTMGGMACCWMGVKRPCRAKNNGQVWGMRSLTSSGFNMFLCDSRKYPLRQFVEILIGILNRIIMPTNDAIGRP